MAKKWPSYQLYSIYIYIYIWMWERGMWERERDGCERDGCEREMDVRERGRERERESSRERERNSRERERERALEREREIERERERVENSAKLVCSASERGRESLRIGMRIGAFLSKDVILANQAKLYKNRVFLCESILANRFARICESLVCESPAY